MSEHEQKMEDEMTDVEDVEVDEDDTEMSVEELALSNDAIQDALVELLIQKGIITEQELNDKIEELDRAEDEELAEELADADEDDEE